MKKISIKSIIAAMIVSLTMASCSDVLEEQPRSIYEPGFFKTEQGVMGGLTSMYAHLRQFYGQYYYSACETGTDEYTWGSLADSNIDGIDLSNKGVPTPSNSRSDALWNAAFPNINTASGIIENAAEAGIAEELISEARFFRAFDYFLLVQTFGGVPLDLGGGELKFNTTPSRTSVRNTVPEVYTKAVFPDLKIAIENLPERGRVTGGATKTVARLYLAKAYLTYAWWLQNPGNIPTYPEVARTDPDGHDAAWYFQQAYNIALEGIANPGPFGLETYYYDVNLGSNDRNKEILLYADHTESSEFYDGGVSHNWFNGGAPGNQSGWFVTCNYTQVRSSRTADWKLWLNPATGREEGNTVESVGREAIQGYGRPWTLMAPPIGVFTNTFADKTNDSRFDGTFTTVFRANWQKSTQNFKNEYTMYNANGLPIHPGDVVLTFLDEEPTAAVDYSNSVYKSGVGAGVMAGRADFVVAPSHINRIYYPSLWKISIYRTNNGDGLGEPNGSITRPFNIAKFSEFYLIAAEAAVKGAATTAGNSARDLVNVLRARAGKWRWDNNGNVAKTADNSAAMVAATPAAIDINYILAERSREFFGESYRWFDLVRTQKWAEIAGTYLIGAQTSASADFTVGPTTFTRTIEPYHYLRPIPTQQIDRMELSVDEKRAYQNPGYN